MTGILVRLIKPKIKFKKLIKFFIIKFINIIIITFTDTTKINQKINKYFVKHVFDSQTYEYIL